MYTPRFLGSDATMYLVLTILLWVHLLDDATPSKVQIMIILRVIDIIIYIYDKQT